MTAQGVPYTLTIFPEGTRLTEEKLKDSQASERVGPIKADGPPKGVRRRMIKGRIWGCLFRETKRKTHHVFGPLKRYKPIYIYIYICLYIYIYTPPIMTECGFKYRATLSRLLKPLYYSEKRWKQRKAVPEVSMTLKKWLVITQNNGWSWTHF